MDDVLEYWLAPRGRKLARREPFLRGTSVCLHPVLRDKHGSGCVQKGTSCRGGWRVKSRSRGARSPRTRPTRLSSWRSFKARSVAITPPTGTAPVVAACRISWHSRSTVRITSLGPPPAPGPLPAPFESCQARVPPRALSRRAHARALARTKNQTHGEASLERTPDVVSSAERLGTPRAPYAESSPPPPPGIITTPLSRRPDTLPTPLVPCRSASSGDRRSVPSSPNTTANGTVSSLSRKSTSMILARA